MILASASARRAAILRTLRIPFEVLPSGIDESPMDGERPEEQVSRLSKAKALAVWRLRPEHWVLAGDTLVTLDGAMLGKPHDRDEACRMLMRLQGRTHRVHSGLALAVPAGEAPVRAGESHPATGDPDSDDSPGLFSGTQVTEVTFRAFDEPTARAYVRTGEPMDKAGAYGIQGLGGALVESIDGDYTGVVGLPIPLLLRLLEEAGRPYRFPRDEPAR